MLTGSITAAVLGLWALVRGYLWRREQPVAGSARIGITAIEAAIAALIIVTAYEGGELVYQLGVGVARAAS